MNIPSENKNFNKLNILVCGLISFFLIIRFFHFSQYGFDLTDEGYYFNSIIAPSLYEPGITLFGYFYHFFYILLSKNFVFLRAFNLISIYLLGWISIRFLFKYCIPNHLLPFFWRELLIFNFSIFSLLYIFPFSWLITPSYNSMNFQGLLISNLGLILISEKNFIKSILGYIILGVGGTIIFLAKPSSAALYGIFVLIYLFFSKEIEIRRLLMTFFVSMSLYVLFVIYSIGSANLFIKGIKSSIENYKLITDGQPIFRGIGLHLVIQDLILGLFIAGSLIPLGLIDHKRKKSLYNIFITFSILLVAFLLYGYKFIDFQKLQIHQISYLIFPITGIALVLLNLKYRSIFHEKFRKLITLGFIFLVTPFAFAFGTSNPYSFQMQVVSFFWILGSVCFFSAIIESKNLIKIIVIICSECLILMLILFNQSLNAPYRQESFKHKNHYSLLRIDDHSAFYANKKIIACRDVLEQNMKQKGFKKGQAIVDLSNSPGLVFALGGKAIGAPWILRLEKNFMPYLLSIFKNHFEYNERPWLMINDKKDPKVLIFLKSFRFNIREDFEFVDEEFCQHDYNDGKLQKIIIYKPKLING